MLVNDTSAITFIFSMSFGRKFKNWTRTPPVNNRSRRRFLVTICFVVLHPRSVLWHVKLFRWETDTRLTAAEMFRFYRNPCCNIHAGIRTRTVTDRRQSFHPNFFDAIPFRRMYSARARVGSTRPCEKPSNPQNKITTPARIPRVFRVPAAKHFDLAFSRRRATTWFNRDEFW